MSVDTSPYSPPAGETWRAYGWETASEARGKSQAVLDSQAAPARRLMQARRVLETVAGSILVVTMFAGVALSLFFIGSYVDSGLRGLSSLSFVESIEGSPKASASNFGRSVSGSSLFPSSR
ncbi:MAG: hypothetical protein AB8B50_09750 [Pirellulaceae bacterium]